jgi:DNA-binding NtrC family response regulator
MYKILVVDDEPRIAKVLQHFLVKMGFEATTAAGGGKAIEILNSGIKPDLIILDMKMPKVTGPEVLKHMQGINCKVPVIILTGSIDAEKYFEDLKELNFRAENIVYKPVDLFTLLETVRKKLKIAQADQEAGK